MRTMDETPHYMETGVWDAAAQRCEFQLTYNRAGARREFDPTELSGKSIPDAYRPDKLAPGDWCSGDTPIDAGAPDTEDTWIDHYASMAVNETVHEALEWFRVDGAPWLDPHGEHEAEIYELCAEFTAKLASLRNGGQP